MTKFPLPGFSLLISTIALDPTAFWILEALVLNAPQDLHASTKTIFSVMLSALVLDIFAISTLPTEAAFLIVALAFVAAAFVVLRVLCLVVRPMLLVLRKLINTTNVTEQETI